MAEYYSIKTSKRFILGMLLCYLNFFIYLYRITSILPALINKIQSNHIKYNFYTGIFIIAAFVILFFIKTENIYTNTKIFPFFIISILVPIALTTKSFNIELFKFVLFEISLLFLFIYFLKYNLPIKKNSFDSVFLIFIIYNLILLFIHKVTLYSIIEFNRILIFYTFFYFVISFPFKKKDIHFIANTTIAISIIISIYGIFQFFGYDIFQWAELRKIHIMGYHLIRSSSTFAHPNALASYLIIAISFTIYQLSNTRKSWVYIIPLILNSLCFLTTFSRAAIGAFILASFTIYIILKFKYSPKTIHLLKVLSIFLAVVIILGSFLILISGRTRLAELVTGKRIGIFKTTINMIQDNLLFGVGPGNYKLNFSKYQTKDLSLMRPEILLRVTHAHNEYLEIFAETGIFGFLLYLYILYIVIKIIIKKLIGTKKVFSLTSILSIALFSILIQNLASIELRGYIIPIFLILILGLIFNKAGTNDE